MVLYKEIMKHLVFIIIGISLLPACTYRPKEKRLSQFVSDYSRIQKSFYKMNGDTIEFKRILAGDKELILQEGHVFLGDYALTHQKFKSITKYRNEVRVSDSLTNTFINQGLSPKMVDQREVMFIQLIPDSAMGNLEFLGFMNLRQEIEEKIDARLRAKDLGEWFAGDMGAGGNMLFFIDDWDSATEITLEVLREEALLDHVLIAKRILTAKDDWNYEIVYPLTYEGIFNQM
ncbi:hypothetical protein D770_05020 [Flammeovirgaceae bacterium 311]|nr:hypothetical protein D770_05020 [Flammeovirgaceae bacterium 311]